MVDLIFQKQFSAHLEKGYAWYLQGFYRGMSPVSKTLISFEYFQKLLGLKIPSKAFLVFESFNFSKQNAGHVLKIINVLLF